MLKKENLILLGIFIFIIILTTVSQFEAKKRLAEYIAKGGDQEKNETEDSGKKINVPLNKFSKILIKDNANIKITGGSNYEIICTDKDKLISNLTLEDDVVVIFGDSEFLLRANELVSIEVSGRANVKIKNFSADSLFLISGKEASISVSECNIRKLNIKSTEISTVFFEKNEKIIDTLEINISGQSSVEIYSDIYNLAGKVSQQAQFYADKADKINVQTEKKSLKIYSNQHSEVQ